MLALSVTYQFARGLCKLLQHQSTTSRKPQGRAGGGSVLQSCSAQMAVPESLNRLPQVLCLLTSIITVCYHQKCPQMEVENFHKFR